MIMDPKQFPPTLPEKLGLTESEMEIARTAIEQAKDEPVPTSHVISGLVSLLSQASDDSEFSLADAITLELRDEHERLCISIAYRAFAMGRDAGRQEAKGASPEAGTETDQAENEEDQAN
jgi:hypothetical protein